MGWLRSLTAAAPEARTTLSDWSDELNNLFYSFGGNQYVIDQTYSSQGNRERIAVNFPSYAAQIFKSNGAVAACMYVRMLAFSEARFQWRKYINGVPGDLYGDSTLAVLEEPWPSGTTGELLARMEQDVSLAGNSFITRRDFPDGTSQLRRLRPDRVEILWGSNTVGGYDPELDIDAHVVGFFYWPHGIGTGDSIFLPVENVAHFSPIPDPLADWRGMSWITPILREIESDGAATDHKLNFFRNGATPNAVVKFPMEVTKDKFEQFKLLMDSEHRGMANAYKTLYLGAGADFQVVGSSFQQMDFKVTQGAGESRIAAASRVPAVMVGFSEGLAGSALNAGNYGQARRNFADLWARPSWRMACASLEKLCTGGKPRRDGSHLWFDDRHIAFLRDDEADLANIRQSDSNTILQLVNSGYEPASVVDAVTANDFTRLVHSGLVSVQLQPPGAAMPGEGAPPDLAPSVEPTQLPEAKTPVPAPPAALPAPAPNGNSKN